MSHTSLPHYPGSAAPAAANYSSTSSSDREALATVSSAGAIHPQHRYHLGGGSSTSSASAASGSGSGRGQATHYDFAPSPPISNGLVSPLPQLSHAEASHIALPPASSLLEQAPASLKSPTYQLRDFGVLRQAPAVPQSSSSASSSSTNPAYHQQQQHHLRPTGLSAHRALPDFPTLQIPPSAKFLQHPYHASSSSASLSPYEAHSSSFAEQPAQYGSSSNQIPGQPSSSSSRRHYYTSPHSPYPSVSTPGLHPFSAASSISLGERGYRSPHPPLTAAIGGQFYLPPIQVPIERDHLGRPIFASPVSYPSVPPPLGQSHLHGDSLQDNYLPPPNSAPLVHLIPPPPPLHHHHSYHGPGQYYPAPPHTATSSGFRAQSPIRIPEPLRFNFSASPPKMPRVIQTSAATRTKYHGALPAANGTSHLSSMTPLMNTPSGSIRSSRANLKGWTVENTYDDDGRKKEVVVIHDTHTPEMVPKKRTRAVAAQEAAAAENLRRSQLGTSNGYNSVSAHSATGAPTVKKRKIDESSDAGSVKKAKAKGSTSSAIKIVPPAQAKPATATADGQAASQTPWDDAEGHYVIKPDDIIGGRYKIIRLLGQGTFGKVVEARHLESRAKVAIKVIRAVQKYRDASKIEVRVLQTLKKNDPSNDNKCIHLSEVFDYRNHPCLVSELYGMSVFDFLKLNGFQPFPDKHIQDFARSLLKSVAFLHGLKLVHTDLKPENILLVQNEAWQQGPRTAKAKQKRILRNTDIRLIDFGSATFENEYHSSVVSTRHYRAPEIILGLPWSYPCDMFSIGCILVEFYTGDALFQTHDNLEHLAMMELVMGKMPARMLEKGKQKKPEFFRGSKIDYPNAQTTKASKKFVKGLKSLGEIIPANSAHNKLFLDLIIRLLDFDPDHRMNVNQALKHPYLNVSIPEPTP